MSKKEQQIYDLMVVIRKNTQPSEGINVFENLMKEISDEPMFDVVLSDMNKFIEHFMLLVKEIDKMSDVKLKSKILTYDFIFPQQYFKRSFSEVGRVLSKLKTLNYVFKEERQFNMGKRNLLGNVPKARKLYEPWKNIVNEPNILSNEIKEQWYEIIRKEILIWNYMPAIVKAMIMTKRRSLGLDSNSKRFANE